MEAMHLATRLGTRHRIVCRALTGHNPRRHLATTDANYRPSQNQRMLWFLLGAALTGIGFSVWENIELNQKVPTQDRQLYEYAQDHVAVEKLLDELEQLPIEPHERLLLDILKQDGSEKEYADHLTAAWKWRCKKVIDRSGLSYTLKLTVWAHQNRPQARFPLCHDQVICSIGASG